MEIDQPTPNRRKAKEFYLFAEWFAAVRMGAIIDEADRAKLGLDDDNLYAIQNQKEFAEKYDVEQATLSDWKREDEFHDLVSQNHKKWARLAIPKAMRAFMDKLVKTGNPQSMKLLLEYADNFTTKTEVVNDEVREAREQLDALLAANVKPSNNDTEPKSESGNSEDPVQG